MAVPLRERVKIYKLVRQCQQQEHRWEEAKKSKAIFYIKRFPTLEIVFNYAIFMRALILPAQLPVNHLNLNGEFCPQFDRSYGYFQQIFLNICVKYDTAKYKMADNVVWSMRLCDRPLEFCLVFPYEQVKPLTTGSPSYICDANIVSYYIYKE